MTERNEPGLYYDALQARFVTKPTPAPWRRVLTRAWDLTRELLVISLLIASFWYGTIGEYSQATWYGILTLLLKRGQK